VNSARPFPNIIPDLASLHPGYELTILFLDRKKTRLAAGLSSFQ
jgi:hypothetical protein